MVEFQDLHRLPTFEDLSRKELEAVAPLCEKRRIAKGVTLFQEDRQATRLYVLDAGRIVILMNGAHGQRAMVYTVQPGESFSWSALVPPRRYTASALAIESSDVYEIDGRKLSRLFKREPALGYKIMCRVSQLVSKRLRHTRLQLLNIHDWQTAEQAQAV